MKNFSLILYLLLFVFSTKANSQDKMESIYAHSNKEGKQKEGIFYHRNPLSSNGMFYLKAGIGLNTLSSRGFFGDCYSFRFKEGETLDLGYSRYLGKSHFYLAAEIGLTSRGAKVQYTNPYYNSYYYGYGMGGTSKPSYYEEYSVIHHGIKISPVVFGYRFMLPKDFAIDPHIGCYLAYYYQGVKQTNYGTTETNGTGYQYYEQYYTPDYEKLNHHKFTDKPGDVSYDPEFTHEKRFDAGLNIGATIWYRRFCFELNYQIGFCSYRTVLDEDIDVYSENYYKLVHSASWKLDPDLKIINHSLQFKIGISL